MTPWPTSTVGEVTLTVTKGTTPTTLGRGFIRSGVRFIKVESLTPAGQIDPQRVAFIDAETHQVTLKRSILHDQDLLFSIAGTIGRVARVRQSDLPANVNQAIAIVRPDPRLVESDFLYYCLREAPRIKRAQTRVVQSVQQNLSLAELSKVEIPLPSLIEQRGIASTLGVLDEKLDSNRKSIDLARDLMRALYRRALNGDFVKASSVLTPILGGTPPRAQPMFWGGDIPWASAKDIAASSTGYVVAAAENITAEGVASSAAKVLPSGSIVMTARGTVGALARLAKPMAFNQSCYGLVPKLGVDVTLLFLALEDALQRIRDAGHGTVFNTVNMATFDQIDLALPSSPTPELLAQLEALSSLVLARVHESNRLVATRDALLPELLSGRLRVPEAAEVLA